MVNLKYEFNKQENYGIVLFGENKIFLDVEDIFKLTTSKNKFKYDESNIYPYFYRNKYKVTLLEFIYIFNKVDLIYTFKNNNKYDLRRENVDIKHKYHYEIIQKYPNAIYIQGHYKKNGKDAYNIKNPIWLINDIYYVYCKGDILCKLDKTSYSLIKNFEQEHNIKLTLFKHKNNYIMTTPNDLYIHQIIMNCYGNGKGTKHISVDHIDQNPLNNCFSNLRISDRKTQEGNSKGIKEGTKRARKKSAKPLPDGITQEMLPKYVVYYKQALNKEKGTYREFFQIEKHPKLEPNKRLASTKSMKVSILDKLQDIKEKLYELDNQ